MPLMHGKSEKAFSHNVRAEMDAGKPQNQSLAIAYAMKKKKKMAEGGEMRGVDDDDLEKPAPISGSYAEGGDMDDDMIDRIMCKRMAKGGPVADFEDNDFDVMDKEEGLEDPNTGANSGDEIGYDKENDDVADIVHRIMTKRANKDKMPRPA